MGFRMSVQAMSWAIEQRYLTDPVACHVLLCLSNYAGADGRDAFPSVSRLAGDTRLSERTIQNKLLLLEELGIIVRGNSAVVAARINRLDRRPVVYDIQIKRPLPGSPIESGRGEGDAPRYSQVTNSTHRGEVDAPRDSERGASDESNGVHLTTERGAGGAPDPRANHPQENQKLSPPVGGGDAGKPAKVRKEYPAEFLEAFEAYPKRDVSVSKHDAFKAWSARRKEGVSAETLLAGVKAYAGYIRAKGNWGTSYVKMPATFFGPGEHYLITYSAPAGQAADASGRAVDITSQQRSFAGVDYGTDRIPGWMQAELEAEEAEAAQGRAP